MVLLLSLAVLHIEFVIGIHFEICQMFYLTALLN